MNTAKNSGDLEPGAVGMSLSSWSPEQFGISQSF